MVPAITFASTATAVLYNRLIPVFIDVDPVSSTIDLNDMESKYSKGCVAIMPVHFGGQPAPMDEVMKFAKSKGLAVIEDCAHCAGGDFKQKKLGTWGDIGCFSFEEKKCMTSGDGGMICSDDEDLINPLVAYRWIGIDKDTWKRASSYADAINLESRHWYYEIAVLGYKYNMNDLSASIGLAQLKKLDWMNSKRCDHIMKYIAGIQSLRNIRLMLPYEPEKYVYWIFGVRCERRDDLIMFLKSKGIATGVHYMPLTKHPLFRPYQSECREADKIWKEFVTLPLFVDITPVQIEYVVNALIEFDRNY
jgi:perosamine synthetase